MTPAAAPAVLLVEPDDGHAQAARAAIAAVEPAAEISRVLGVAEIAAAVAGGPVDVIVLDLPGPPAGAEALAVARAAAGPATAIVVWGAGEDPSALSRNGDLARDRLFKAPGSELALGRSVAMLIARTQAGAAESRVTSLLNSIDEGLVLTAVDGTIEFYNRGMERILGFGAEEMIGRHIEVLSHPANPGEAAAIQARSGSGEIQRLEVIRTHKDGHDIDVALTIGPVRDLGGTITGTAGIVLDISRRKRAERELGRTASLLADAEATARIGSWELEVDTGRAGWSDEILKIFGVAPDQITAGNSDPLRARVHPEDLDAYLGMLNGVASTGEDSERIFRIRLPDGGARTLRTRARLVAGSVPRRLVGTCQDITDEQTARIALEIAEEQFRHSFEDALIGMQIVDLDGVFRRVNDAFCAITGHRREDLLGLHRAQVTHPEDRAADAAVIAGLLAGERESATTEKRYLHAAGHPVWASVGVRLIRDSDGRPRHFIVQAQDITERRRYESRLRHLADHDPLTGLLNRRSFERELDGHVARMRRFGVTGAVLMIDLDTFKAYNDSRGHKAGDELLTRIAHALRDGLRESDIVARIGGDEFAALLPQENAEGARHLAASLLERVRHHGRPAGAERHAVSASIGIACFADDPEAGASEIMVRADTALYEAKDRGRDAAVHDADRPPGQLRLTQRIPWASVIGEALADGRFDLLAQPVRALGTEPTESTLHHELLTRLAMPSGERVMPAVFIPAAERLGLMPAIDRWVTGRAIDLLARDGSGLRLAVNVSAHSVTDPELTALVGERLARTGVAGDRLAFEVSESAAIAAPDTTVAFAERLARLGCRFGLDDFGAGLGALTAFRDLRFDYLKLDGELVHRCPVSAADRAIVAGVIHIARDTGRTIAAKMVEDETTAAALSDLGFPFAQGLHLGGPHALPADL